jgi:hypothetical protein
VEVRPPGAEEPLVVEVGVDAGELGGEAFGLVGQERVPGGQRRSGDAKQREVAAWQAARNASGRGVNWRFTTADARIKLKHLYPAIQD